MSHFLRRGFAPRPSIRAAWIGRFCVLALCLAVSGCQSAPDSISDASRQQIKTLGVISSLGADLHFERIGAGGWDNDFYTVASTPLGLDAHFTSLVGKALAGRFDVRPVQYNPVDFAPGEDDTAETIAARIRSAARPSDLDAYLLVLPANSMAKSSGQRWDFSSQQISGLGLTRKSLITEHEYWAHVLYAIVMVDGHTGKILSETIAEGGYQDLGLLEMPAMGGPYRDVDEAVWPEDPQHPTQAVTTRLLDDTLKPLFAQSLPPTLKTANLLP